MPEVERKILHALTYMWDLKTKCQIYKDLELNSGNEMEKCYVQGLK
jgi:hypothetical protein